MQRACDVHARLDQDKTPREVGYCGFCGEYMCADCARNPLRRAKAMAMKYIPWGRKAA